MPLVVNEPTCMTCGLPTAKCTCENRQVHNTQEESFAPFGTTDEQRYRKFLGVPFEGKTPPESDVILPDAETTLDGKPFAPFRLPAEYLGEE